MGAIVDIFRQHAARYLQIHNDNILPSHRRTIHDIGHCRTPSMGGHVYQCSHCAYYHYSYHCCGNRHCPQCRGQATERWVQQRLAEVMPVSYFHLVFTLPAEHRGMVRRHQKIAYGVLLKAAAAALMKLCADERYLGAQIGILAVLHTWGRAMIYHPHAHLLVPGVGVSRDGVVAYFSRRGYLVPGKALSRIFRAKFIAMLKAALPEERIPPVPRKKDWVVFCKHLDLGPEKAIAYLGRYLNRVAVNDSRVHRLPGGQVCVRYRHKHQEKRVALSPNEFLRRYLQHVLPKGFNKVRRYGLLAPGNATRLKALRHQLLLTAQIRVATLAALAAVRTRIEHQRWRRCPQCGQGIMQRMLPLASHFRSRSPPLTVMALYPK
jgi:hypothetical protein